jgi:hypothetical protein
MDAWSGARAHHTGAGIDVVRAYTLLTPPRGGSVYTRDFLYTNPPLGGVIRVQEIDPNFCGALGRGASERGNRRRLRPESAAGGLAYRSLLIHPGGQRPAPLRAGGWPDNRQWFNHLWPWR